MKPRLLDLFCGAGGAAMGYHRAGFEVVGVDINPQPHYPFEFHKLNAFDALDRVLAGHWPWVTAIHASPPCQAFSITGNLARGQGNQASAIDLLTPLRPLLEAAGLPYIIENVAGAPLRDPVTLCGSTFGLGVRRHRLFESSLLLHGAGLCRHSEQGRPIGVYGSPADDIPNGGRTARNVAEAQAAMGIDWMPRWSELKESVPARLHRMDRPATAGRHRACGMIALVLLAAAGSAGLSAPWWLLLSLGLLASGRVLAHLRSASAMTQQAEEVVATLYLRKGSLRLRRRP